MSQYKFTALSEEDTDRLGAALAELLPAGTTMALCGTLGSGKTRLVQAIVQAYGVAREDVTSPTFVLCQEYYGRRRVFHLDAYRIADDDEFLELGPEEYFQSPHITIVEWADRVERCLPDERIQINAEVTGDCSREFEIVGIGERYQGVVEKLASRLASRI